LFRTIKPVPYPGRAPHIHVAVSRNGRRLLTTQLLIQGHPMNERDGLYRGIPDRAARESLLVDFRPLAESKLGELQANFDIVLGQTAFEDEQGTLRGGIAPAERQRASRPKR
jgi:protocatechuate 3,4-dioxygenase beta subunit